MSKRLMTLAAVSVAVIGLSAAPALADHHGGGERAAKGWASHADEDGNITKDDFLKFHAERFDKMDTNNDGVLSAEERKAVWEARKEKMKEKRGERRGGYKKKKEGSEE